MPSRTWREEGMLATLREARMLITPRRSWTRGEFHRITDSGDKYCALGAITEVSLRRTGAGFTQCTLCALTEALPWYARRWTWTVMVYNDAFGHRMTLRLFDRAIRNVERQAALKRRQDAFSQAVALAARRDAARARTAPEEELVVAGD